MAKIAEAFVDISARTQRLRAGLKKAIANTAAAVKKMGSVVGAGMLGIASIIKKVLGGILGFVTKWAKRLALAITAAIGISIKLASDAEQTFSRFRIVLGKSAEEAEKFANTVARAVGRSNTAIADSIATFQSFFVGLGFSNEQSFKLSKTLSRLALDFASFNNISDAEAMQRFIAALSGSGEVLDRFGINIKQAALEQELLRAGLKGTLTGVNEQQKAVARMGIIMRAMTDQGAVGNAVETADEFANVLKRLGAAFKTLGVTIGNQFLDRSGKVLKDMALFVEDITKFVDPLFRHIETLASGVLDKLNEITGLRLGSGNLLDEIRIALFELQLLITRVFDTAVLKLAQLQQKVTAPAIKGTVDFLGGVTGADALLGLLGAEGGLSNFAGIKSGGIGDAMIEAKAQELEGRADRDALAVGKKRLEIELQRSRIEDRRLRNQIRAESGLPQLTLGDIPSPAAFGSILDSKTIKGIVASVATATGTFKIAARSREVALLEKIEKTNTDGVVAQRETTRAVQEIGFA